MIPKTIVVAPTTAVPIRTGLAVALNVFPAPSPFSSWCLASTKSGLNPKSLSISAEMSCFDSIWESSKTDWALSVTGPKLSTAIVTGPIPRNPKATRPNAKIGRGEPELRGHDRLERGVARGEVRAEHEGEDDQAHPEGAEVAGHEARTGC